MWSYLCCHIAGILQDLSRAEFDNRLLVAARDNATTEPAAGARVCPCDTAQWRACIDLNYSCGRAENSMGLLSLHARTHARRPKINHFHQCQ